MKVHSIVEESVASPRMRREKSAALRLDLEGETHLPLQTSPIRRSYPRASNHEDFHRNKAFPSTMRRYAAKKLDRGMD